MLTLLVLPGVAAVYFSAVWMLNVKQERTTKSDTSYLEAATIAEECFRSVRTLYSFTSEKREVQGYAAAVDRSKDAYKTTAVKMGLALGFQASAVYIFIAIALFFGRLQIFTWKTGQTSAGVLAVIFLVFNGLIYLQQAA
ncbi:unnamed protein product, partial [Amoebophrya sp. A120]|eukprot:GSA120T00005307001.1